MRRERTSVKVTSLSQSIHCHHKSVVLPYRSGSPLVPVRNHPHSVTDGSMSTLASPRLAVAVRVMLSSPTSVRLFYSNFQAGSSRRIHRPHFLAQTLSRRSLTLQSTPAAGAPFPRNFLAPSFRFSVNRSRAPANASFTNSLLPMTAPSVKYLTRHFNIFAILNSGSTVPLSSAASASAVLCIGFTFALSTSARPLFRPSANPIARR